MQRHVAVDGVVFRVGAHRRGDASAQVALLAQDVVELQHDRERTPLEEALRHLRVPYQLVGVERVVGISTARVHVEVGRQRGAPWGRGADAAAIAVLPHVGVGGGLQLVVGVAVVERAVELHLKPTVAVAAGETVADGHVARGVLYGVGVATERYVAHVVGVVEVGESVNVPESGRVERRVEHQRGVHVPVAVDVLRSRYASAGRLVVGHLVADAVSRVVEVDESHHRLLGLLEVAVVEQAEVLVERRFQARVTRGDVERVGVVVDVEQLRDAGLRGRGTIVDAQVAHLVELVSEVEGRGEVGDVASGVHAHSLVVLHVV